MENLDQMKAIRGSETNTFMYAKTIYLESIKERSEYETGW